MSMPLPEIDTLTPTSLQTHFQQCTFASGTVHRLSCMLEAIEAFIAPRLISVLVAVVVLIEMSLSLPFGSP